MTPESQGERAFIPCFALFGETGDFLWSKFCSGNRYAARGAIEFLKECLKRLPCEIVLSNDSHYSLCCEDHTDDLQLTFG